MTFDAVEGAKAYVIHYSGANESDPHKATFMGYTESSSWMLAATDVPELTEGDKIYLYVQSFNDLGEGATDIDKAAYLHDNKLGSEWSDALILTK